MSDSHPSPVRYRVGEAIRFVGLGGPCPAEFRGYHSGATGETLARIILLRREGRPPCELSVRPVELDRR